MKHTDLIRQMTLEEKAGLCAGSDFWHTTAIERLGIPAILMSDGPHGLRKQDGKADHLGLNASVPATCFPTAATVANAWDRELVQEMGRALGEEARQEQVSVVLGPGINVKRSPRCGRNFEYFSEDPYLSGELAIAYIEGVQSQGVGVSLKHFAANSQETHRITSDSIVDERALREIYLSGFEKAVKQAKPWTVMCAYNRLNGTYCGDNPWLLTDVLRGEWGFDGVVVTDWGAENDRVAGLRAGQELEMPSAGGVNTLKIIEAVRSGALEETVLDEAVDRVLTLVDRAKGVQEASFAYDQDAHHALARKIARESIVLLKNEDEILPLSPDQRIAVVGELARSPRYQGAGSSHINPTRIDSAFNALLDAGLSVAYAPGYDKTNDTPNEALIADACRVARGADVTLVFAGLTEKYEAEGFDRRHMRLPACQNALIDALCAVSGKVVVLLAGGSPVEMPWIGRVQGAVACYLGGQAGGGAVADIVTGRGNPSGKLAETYPLAMEDTACAAIYPSTRLTAEYRESIYVGYRYYDKVQKDVLFPFGYGLSYTTFQYSALKLGKRHMRENEELTVSFTVRNTGKTAGAEIAQVYVADVESSVFKAPRELKGFVKVFLQPGEERRVTCTLDRRAFAYYNTAIGDWHVEDGVYQILIGASSRDIRLKGSVRVASAQPEAPLPDWCGKLPAYESGEVAGVPDEQFALLLGRAIPSPDRDPAKPFDRNNTLLDAADTKWGRVLLKIVDQVLDRLAGKGERDMYDSFKEWPIRNFVNMSNGLFSEDMADGMLMILNDREAGLGLMKLLKGLGGSARNLPDMIANL